MSFFEVKNMRAGYGKRRIIDGISFSVDKHTLTGVLGANGSGKTTLLKAVCGIIPHDGECFINGRRLEDMRPKQLAARCSYIAQRSGIAIDIPAIDVALMGFNPRMRLLQHPDPAMKERARSMLKLVGLEGREDENYLNLSEGQKQLCILARTLCSDAELLLLDEPESALDFRYRYRMLDIIKRWLTSGERAAVVALHDPMLALNYCERLLLVKDGALTGEVRPESDDTGHIEEMLSAIYGNVSVIKCTSRSGRGRLVMLREEDDDESSYAHNIL